MPKERHETALSARSLHRNWLTPGERSTQSWQNRQQDGQVRCITWDQRIHPFQRLKSAGLFWHIFVVYIHTTLNDHWGSEGLNSSRYGKSSNLNRCAKLWNASDCETKKKRRQGLGTSFPLVGPFDSSCLPSWANFSKPLLLLLLLMLLYAIIFTIFNCYNLQNLRFHSKTPSHLLSASG